MSSVARVSTPVHGLRTRYFPKNRLGHGFVAAVPWVNIVLLIFFFYWLHDKMVLQPGTPLRLAREPLTTASRSDMTAVLQRAESSSSQESPLLYFNDHVFNIGKNEDMEAFRSVLASATTSSSRKSLVLYVDASFTFDVVNSIINLAREAGVGEINLASQPLIAAAPTEP